MARYIDIGFNLPDKQFAGVYNGKKKHQPDLREVMKNAASNGVRYILCTGTSLATSQRCLKLCCELNRETEAGGGEAAPCKLLATAGIHPTSCSKYKDSTPEELATVMNELENIILAECVKLPENEQTLRGLGEMGLDKDRLFFADLQTQKKVFLAQLQMVKKIRAQIPPSRMPPLFLHTRASTAEFIECVRSVFDRPGGSNDTEDAANSGVPRGVVHSFDGTLEEARQLLDLGFELGVNGCGLRTLESHQVVVNIPLEKLHVETDAPWCIIKPSHSSFPLVQWEVDPRAPRKAEAHTPGSPVKGRCEPVHVSQVAEVLYRLRSKLANTEPTKEGFRQFTDSIFSNSARLLGLA